MTGLMSRDLRIVDVRAAGTPTEEEKKQLNSVFICLLVGQIYDDQNRSEE